MSYTGMTYGDISPRVGLHSVAKMLVTAKPQLVFEKYASVTEVPKNKGLLIKFRRPIKFPAATTPLTEGVTPTSNTLNYEDVSVALAQYGSWVQFTDVIVDTHEDPVLNDISEQAGDQAALTKERLMWGMLRGGTNVLFTGGDTVRTDVETPLDLDDIRAAVRILKNNHGKMITKVLKASTSVATEPVGASYVAFAHTNLEADFRDMTSFVPTEKYGSGGVVSEFEIGKVENVRIILTNHAEPFYGGGGTTLTGVLNNGTRVDVYPVIIFGQDAYACTPLSGGSLMMGVKNPKMASGDTDPLGQRGYMSWKMWFACLILNQAWIVRLETAASAL